MTRISLQRCMTTDVSELDTSRQATQKGGPVFADNNSIAALLEGLADPDTPLILEVLGTRKLDEPHAFALREVRQIIGFKSQDFLKAEAESAEAARLAELENKKRNKVDQIRREIHRERQMKTDELLAGEENKIQESERRLAATITAEAMRRFIELEEKIKDD